MVARCILKTQLYFKKFAAIIWKHLDEVTTILLILLFVGNFYTAEGCHSV